MKIAIAGIAAPIGKPALTPDMAVKSALQVSGSTDCVLLGDIGATNARLALLTGSALGPVTSFQVARFARFADVVDLFLRDHCGQCHPKRALFAIAAPVEGERSALTNSQWVIDASELQSAFNVPSQLLNDFEAVAHSLALLEPSDSTKIGGGALNKTLPMAVLGPGTGLGVACSVPRSGKPVVIQSEGGHATLAGTCDREDDIINRLRQRFGHASAERALSGPGLENIYRAIGALDTVETPLQNATEITRSALRGERNTAVEALDTFCALLGSFAGSVALTFGARGGVYIAGGIPPRIVDFMRRSQFRDRFEAKGRFREYLKTIPVHVITHPAAAFIGLRSLLSDN
jgi:glucokinase